MSGGRPGLRSGSFRLGALRSHNSPRFGCELAGESLEKGMDLTWLTPSIRQKVCQVSLI